MGNIDNRPMALGGARMCWPFFTFLGSQLDIMLNENRHEAGREVLLGYYVCGLNKILNSRLEKKFPIGIGWHKPLNILMTAWRKQLLFTGIATTF
jgi:hypothetical protein